MNPELKRIIKLTDLIFDLIDELREAALELPFSDGFSLKLHGDVCELYSQAAQINNKYHRLLARIQELRT